MSYSEQNSQRSQSTIRELVNNQQLPSLISNVDSQIFAEPSTLPQILNNNLVSNNRIVKEIKNDGRLINSVLRGFYYQLLKLCFEMYDEENFKNYLQITKEIIFDQSLVQEADTQIMYKHLAEFFELMEEEQAEPFEEVIARHHQIDEAFIGILQQLNRDCNNEGNGQEEVENILNNLCEIFQIQLVPGSPFYHFETSGVYLYVDESKTCFIIFEDDEEEEEEGEEEEEEGEQGNEGENDIHERSEGYKYQIHQNIRVEESLQSKSNPKSEISNSSRGKSPNLSQLTENNLKNDINFSKQYTFQPQFKGQQQIFLTSGKGSEVSVSIYSKQCNSRPVSNLSYKSHLSSQSQSKKREQVNWAEMRVTNTIYESNSNFQPAEKLEIPQNQPAYSPDPFKKGTLKISNPYEISNPYTSSCQGSNHFAYQDQQPPSTTQRSSNPYYTSAVKDQKPGLGQSHYVNNSLSSYYQGYYGQIPQNVSVQSHSTTSKNDTIINMFGDMLKSGKHEPIQSFEENSGNRPTKKLIQETEQILQAQEEHQKQDSEIYPDFMKKINKLDKIDMMDHAKSVNSINSHNSDFNSNSISGSKGLQYSVAEKPHGKETYKHFQAENRNYSGIIEQKAYSYVNGSSSSSNIEVKFQAKQQPIVNFDDDQALIYKPKRSLLKVISEVTASKQSISLAKNSDNFDDSKGSIYRQFSDTRILKLLKQPHKTKIQIMRNRFKGQHFNK